jgi:hypothetical protein
MPYIVKDTLGRTSAAKNLREAKRLALRGTGSKRAFTCGWFLVPQGDVDVQQTLVWSSKKEAHNDDGRRSVASITRTVHVVGGDQ